MRLVVTACKVKFGNMKSVAFVIDKRLRLLDFLSYKNLMLNVVVLTRIVSLNPIMVDGTGMCGACRLVVGDKVKFACVDGPEFDGHLVDFDQAMRRQAQYKTEEGRAMLALEEGDTHHGGCGHCH